ncbi:MAG: phosphoglycerate kinase [Patescibacteria group bacterium]
MDGIKLASDLTAADLRGKKVLVRVDLNLPLQDGEVSDDFRFQKTLPLLQFLLKQEAKIILLSHLGGAAGSLLPVSRWLQKFLPHVFVESFDAVAVERGLAEKPVVLLENLRRDRGEENNLSEFAERLAKFGDLYINEAFSVSHRAHASVAALPKLLPHYVGPRFKQEYEQLSKAFTPEHPFIFILGGAKFTTKVPVLKKFMYLADQIFIHGALANAFFKELGYQTGTSLVDEQSDLARQFLKFEKIILPVDVRVRRGTEVSIKKPDELNKEDEIIDVGVDSLEQLGEAVATAKFVLWNGPVGRFEFGFKGGTDAVAKMVAEAEAYSIIGGGDTLAAIRDLNLLDKFDFISTAGGAMLDFLAEGTLPGIEALKA